MRRLEYLIKEVRESTDNEDTNGISDAELIGYFNYGQKLIQNIIFKSNPKADIFKAVVEYSPNSDGEYDLPDNIFAQNSVSLVEVKTGIDTVNDGYRPVDKVDKSEASNLFGYYIEDKTLKLTGMNTNYNVQSVRVTYFKALPKVDKRWGKILSFVAGNSITLDTDYDPQYVNVDDHLTVVDKYGAQVRANVYIDSASLAVIQTTDALTGVQNNQFVCMGKDSVNASLLPDECLTYLLDYVRQRIYTRNNYDDANKQVYFTDKQEMDISDLFRNNQKDILYPPITDTSMLEW
jgi:hypothetical protein